MMLETNFSFGDELFEQQQQKKNIKNNNFQHSQSMARRLHIKICQWYDLKKMDTIGRSDPYVTLRLKSQDKKQALTTLVLSNTLDPIWNQEFDITAIDPNDTLYIDMCDEGIKNDDKMMGRLEYPVSTWQIGAPVDHKEVELILETKKAG